MTSFLLGAATTGNSLFDAWFDNFWLALIAKTIVVMLFFLMVPLVVGYIEHKVLAHMQARLGPMEAGMFHGWAQLVADGVKFVQKEDVVPEAADRGVFSLAPAVAMIPYIIILVVLPFSPTLFALNLDVGIFFVMAMSSVSVIGVLMAGWSSREQVLADRRAPGGRAADRVRAPAGARGRRDRDAGRDALAGRHRRVAAQHVEHRAAVAAGGVPGVRGGVARRAHPPAVRHAGRRLRDHLRRLHRVHGLEVRVLPAGGVRRHRGAGGHRVGPVPGRLPRSARGSRCRRRSGCWARSLRYRSSSSGCGRPIRGCARTSCSGSRGWCSSRCRW